MAILFIIKAGLMMKKEKKFQPKTTDQINDKDFKIENVSARTAGQPRKVIRPEQYEQIERLSGVLTAGQLADYLGMARSTFFAMMKTDEVLARRYKAGRALAIASIADNLYQKALKGDSASIFFYLKTQAGYRETSVVLSENKEVKSFSDMYEDQE